MNKSSDEKPDNDEGKESAENTPKTPGPPFQPCVTMRMQIARERNKGRIRIPSVEDYRKILKERENK